MNKNVRIAIQLQHKDDSISENAGSLSFGDFEWNGRRFLRYANGNNEWLLFKDTATDDISRIINDIIQIGDKQPKVDPSLIFMYQFDDNNNPTYSDDVLNKWKAWFVDNYKQSKPYIWNVYDNGLHAEIIPILHEKCVMTSVRFDGDRVDYKSIGRAVEGLINRFINIENNLTFRLVHLYDKCMNIAHKLHLVDVNQDSDLLNVWNDLINLNGIYDEIEKWLPNVEMYQKPAIPYTIDIRTSDNGYLYKYVLENINDKDKTPVYNSFIGCEANKSSTFAELLHTKDGILMNSMISKSELTDYIRRDLVDYSGWTGAIASQFVSNPLVPTSHYGDFVGDEDNQIDNVTGSVTLAYKTDVPDFARGERPWIQVVAECYNYPNNKMKTVDCLWEKNNSNKLIVDDSMLLGTFKFNAKLNGYYKVKLLLKVFWGTFNSWTDEVEIAYFRLARGNNSGGTFNLNHYIFDGKSNRILTRYQLIDASKYEKNTTINGKMYGWSAQFDPPITPSMNDFFSVPGSADYHYTRWYGRFINADEPVERVEWSNLYKSNSVDMSKSMHYYKTAQNYGLLTTVNLSASFSGKKAVYTPDKYNTPAIFNPVTKDCTIMLKGGESYKVLSHCKNLRCRQVGIYKVDVGTINAQLLNTVYYGNDAIMSNDFIIKGGKRSYKLDLYGKEPKDVKIASGVPDRHMIMLMARSTPSDKMVYDIPRKPDQEKSPGYISRVNLGREFRLDENPKHDVIITFKDDTTMRFTIPFLTTNGKWNLIWSSEDRAYQRCYMCVKGKIAYFMTYYMDVKKIEINQVDINTLELLARDSQTGEVVMNFSLQEDKPDSYIPVVYNGREYYIEVIDTKRELGDNVIVEDISTGQVKGYLK